MQNAPHCRPGSPLPAGVSLLLALAALAGGCGPVHFVTSPFTAHDVTITYSQQEDLTVFDWKLGAGIDQDAVTFELFEKGSWSPIDFDDAPYPAGGYTCGPPAATCYRFTKLGRYQPPLTLQALRSTHPQHGTLMGLRAVFRELPTTLALAPHLLPGNTELDLGILDEVSPPNTPVRRSFQWRVEPSSQPCPESAPSWNGSTKRVETVPFAEQLTDEGRYCVTVRPEPRVPLTPPTVAAPALTHPVLESGGHQYTPPVEASPVLYQVFYDLEIPNQQRCNDTIAQLQVVLQPLEGRAPGPHQFPPVFLSESNGSRCRQDPSRRLHAAELAEAMKRYVSTEVRESAGAAIVLVYVNNLLLPIDQIARDLGELGMSLASDPRIRPFFWGIASDHVLQSFPFEQTNGWINPWDKALRDSVAQTARDLLPFKTMLHDQHTTVAFVDPHQASVPGKLKMCGMTPTVALTLHDHPVPDTMRVLPVGPADDLGYRVAFEPQVRVKSGEYVEHKVEVRYEICRRWCEHPFQTTTGEWLGPDWLQHTRCREGE